MVLIIYVTRLAELLRNNMKTYIPEFRIGTEVWVKLTDRIYLSTIDYIILDFNGNFKYHLAGLMGNFDGTDLRLGCPVM